MRAGPEQMRNYFRAIAAFPPDVKRFLVFNAFAIIAYGIMIAAALALRETKGRELTAEA